MLDHTGVVTLKHQGSTYTDSQDKAQLLADYFTPVFTQENTSHIPELNDIDALPSIPQILVQIDGVAQLLSNIKVKKARGPDNLPAVWKTAAVVPIFMKGNRSDPGNYKPVWLTCICCKILEHIIYSI